MNISNPQICWEEMIKINTKYILRLLVQSRCILLYFLHDKKKKKKKDSNISSCSPMIPPVIVAPVSRHQLMVTLMTFHGLLNA